MSEARNKFGRNSVTPKTKKTKPRVDLTAMVSISFLLIIFFMLTSYLARPQAMDLGIPDNEIITCGGDFECGDGRNMTLLLGEGDKIISYTGSLALPLENPKLLSYDNKSLTKELFHRNNHVMQHTGDPKKGLIVMVKPSKKSNYKNLVDVLDALGSAKVPVYTIIDITPEEENLLAKY